MQPALCRVRNVREIVRYVVLEHLGKFSFAYLPKVRESTRFLMNSLSLITPGKSQSESCHKIAYAWKSVVEHVLGGDEQICFGGGINKSEKKKKKQQILFVLMISQNSTFEVNKRFQFVGQGDRKSVV